MLTLAWPYRFLASVFPFALHGCHVFMFYFVVTQGTSGFSFGSFAAKTTAPTAFGFGPTTTTTASTGFGSKFMSPFILIQNRLNTTSSAICIQTALLDFK